MDFWNTTFVPCILKLYSNMLYICFPLSTVYLSSAVSPLVWNWLFGENSWGHLETWATRVAVWFLMHALIDANYMADFIIYCFCLLLEEKNPNLKWLVFQGLGSGCPFHRAFSVQGLVVESADWKMLLQVKFGLFVKDLEVATYFRVLNLINLGVGGER